MKITMNWNGGSDAFDVPYTESDIWKAVGQRLADIPVPNKLTVSDGTHSAVLELIERGTVAQADGTVKPSLFVTEVYNDIEPEKSSYPEVYLTCVNPYGNNYKFYHIVPVKNGDVTEAYKAEYGRIGENHGGMFGVRWTGPNPSYLFWIRYYEKLSKGYVDQSDIYLAKAKPKPKKKARKAESKTDNASEASKELYKLLLSYARHTVRSTLAHPRNITKKQIDESKKLVEKLKGISPKRKSNLEKFNNTVLAIMVLTPRSVAQVNYYLADSTDDFARIIDREEGLVNAMTVVLNDEEGKETDTSVLQSFAPMGIDVEEPSDEEAKSISALINDDMRPHIKKIYMVNSNKTAKRLDDYCTKRKIDERKLLLHGSRKENWFSITQNGLLLPQNNNAKKCGAGLGYGIYFGNNSRKCSHYTFDGDGTMVIGVFETAYGKPEKIQDNDHNCYIDHTQEELDRKGKDCIHYHRNGCNWADEIVFYNENATSIKALVVLNM